MGSTVQFAGGSALWRFLLTALLLAILHTTARAASSAKELLASGQADEAVQTFEQETRRDSTNAEAYNLLCRAYFMRDEWDRGIMACEHAIKLDPDKGSYHLWMGRIYGEKADRAGFLSAAGLAKKVRTSFERAVQLEPANWEARVDLAEFYLEAPSIVGGGQDKARAQADALLSINPAMAHWVRASIAGHNKDGAAAEREYRAAIEASHGSAQNWLHLAQFLARTSRFAEMDQALLTMESSAVDRADALMDGGSLLLRLGRNYPLAIRLLRRYLEAPAEEGPAFKAHDYLGELLERQGDRRGAAEQYRAALDLFHGYRRAQEDLKRVEK
ncbi:MAG TPA: tetratricopeptide repeat protein [Candidatus Sulfotelmatobacter sp.]|nr:tetratricopeptide repeat protein [Candidatus Sulfotelmatobacter sp.]